ncbi:MAG TPA: hypothetical protein VLW53_01275, partial [Candidatus Eisenbacteria bacterium]|nr:hypothetical protein [Candidatus Eisenbacteria bacterium]
YLAAAALGAGALWAASVGRGRPRPLRALAALTGLLIAYWALYDTEHIVNVVTEDPMAAVMGWPIMGPGPLLAAAGGVVLLGSALSVPAGARGVRRDQWLRLLLAGALLATGAVHLQQVPGRLEVSAALGAGFAAAAASQLALAAAVLLRGHRLLYAAIVADCALVLGLHAWAALHGLPLPGPAPAADPGLRLGAGEPVTLSGAVGGLAGAAAILLAAPLAVSPPHRRVQ